MMNPFRNILSFLFLFSGLMGFAQDTATYFVVGKKISEPFGDKIHTVKYKTLYTLGNQKVADTIEVKFANHTLKEPILDSVMLKIKALDSKVHSIFKCPDFSAEKGIHPVKIDYLKEEYFEKCEKGNCDTFLLNKPSIEYSWIIVFPCSKQTSSISIMGANRVEAYIKAFRIRSQCFCMDLRKEFFTNEGMPNIFGETFFSVSRNNTYKFVPILIR